MRVAPLPMFMSPMTGRRIITDKLTEPHDLEALLRPGDYCKSEKYPELGWYLCAPNGDIGIVRPPVFTITEFPDGSITVGPASVQMYKSDGSKGWHGYLHRGEWIS